MKKTALLLNTFLILFLLTASSAKAAVAGPHLSLNPSSGNYSLNNSFTVTAKVDAAGEVIGGVDGVGSYDASRLELVSITKASGMIFSTAEGGGDCSVENSTSGRFSFTCYANSALETRSLSGDLVVLNFKAKSTGTATVSFTCSGTSTTDSNIVKSSTSSDVIVCGENVNGSYTIGESSGSTSATNTPTPTTSGSATLPQTGGVGMTLGLIVFGTISLASAIFLKFL